MTPLESALAGLWLMLPALIPNSAAVLFGGGTQMDFGRSWRGRRLLGDGKTWRGFFGGSLSGAAFGIAAILISNSLGTEESWGYGQWPEALGIVLCLSFGAMLGDSIGSFVKRRIGLERGRKAPVLDQFNFVAGAIVLVMIFQASWFTTHYVDGNAIWGLVLLLIVVPALHRGINIIGYKLGKKNVPW